MMTNNLDISPYLHADPDSDNIDPENTLNSCNYFTEDSLKSVCVGKNIKDFNSFTLFHLNVRSLPKHFETLTDYLTLLPLYLSIMGFTETWLNDSKASFYSMNGYDHLYHHRKDRPGGGVSLYVKNSIKYILREDLSIDIANTNSHVESIFIEVVNAPCFSGRTVIGCVYRPPNGNVNSFVDNLDKLLNSIEKEKKPCFILGDFNINLLHANSETFLNTLFANAFFPLISQATRITSSSKSIIDNIITNHTNKNGLSGILLTDISDHLPIFTVYHSNKIGQDITRVLLRNFKMSNVKKFENNLSSNQWNSTLSTYDLIKAYSSFNNEFFGIFNQSFPLEKQSIKPKIHKS